MGKLSSSVQQAMMQQHKSRQNIPVWKGPEDDDPNGGITFSLISRWLCCRERFRLLVIEGLKPRDDWNHRLSYGNMWHMCEEALARGPDPTNKRVGPWLTPLSNYVRELCRKYPTSQEQIVHWYEVCKVQFPLYVKHWSRNQDMIDRKPLLQEQVFNIPYDLPSGRTVHLRGKFDSVDLVGKGREYWIDLMENKTKGDVDERQIKQQLSWDLQTMLYLIALTQDTGIDKLEEVKRCDGKRFAVPIKGVKYNIVRRPLSGGRHTIRRHQATKSKPEESKENFYKRLGELIESDTEYFFIRFKMDLLPDDITRFKRECLDPILENIADDYQWWSWIVQNGDLKGYSLYSAETRKKYFGSHVPRHFRMPFGIYNPLLEGTASDLDEYLISKSEVGLQRTTNLFPELQEG